MFELYESQRITSLFGPRTLNGQPNNHKGVDVVGVSDKSIMSPVKGVVIVSTIVLKDELAAFVSDEDIYSEDIIDYTANTWQWGNYVRVDNNLRDRIYMCHMSKRLAKVGDKVDVGSVLGIEGDTGYSFGSHCHLEVRMDINGQYISVDPMLYFMDANETKEEMKRRTGFVDDTVMFLSLYKYSDELFSKLARAYSASKHMTNYTIRSIDDAINVLKKVVGLEDSTITFFGCYRYSEDLIIKLAKSVIL